jgi:diguanylate cyclase (GGDEF)-like protein
MEQASNHSADQLHYMPSVFKRALLVIICLPALIMIFFNLEHRSTSFHIHHAYVIQALMQWSAFSIGIITALLAFVQYKLTEDKVALVIGMSLLFSATLNAVETLLIDVPPYLLNKELLDTLLWTFAHTMSALILLVGLILLLTKFRRKAPRLTTIILLSFLLVAFCTISVYYSILMQTPPQMLFKLGPFFRPYETLYLIVNSTIVLFIYPKIYQKYPSLLTNSILWMCITQIAIATYLLFFSTMTYDMANSIALFLTVITYLIPFSCLIINQILSYQNIVKAQVELQTSKAKLTFIAAHDDLTELYNRHEFENLLSNTISNNIEGARQFTLFVIDIDNFKSVNDALGHLHGNQFLNLFATTLLKLIGETDIVSRIGGDEFAIIAPDVKTPSAARKFALRLLNELCTPYAIAGKLLTESVSIGIAIYPNDGKTYEELLKNASAALFNAKKSGKKTFQFYTKTIRAEQNREAEIESHLRKALKNDELMVHYQPVYNLSTKQIVGAEVLIRWFSPILGQISPAEFIPIAENSNLIVSIGEWVLCKACQQTTQWAEKYHRHLLFSINVSPTQFQNIGFYDGFKNILESFHYPANYLGIEITESMLMENNTTVNFGLKKICGLGASILLDDFGTGYSSLSRLQSLPINALKIDKTFIKHIHNKHDKVVIVDTIITLAHELGMSIIAEGIENETQLAYLISKDCLLGQGFYLSHPLPPAAFEALAYQ